jgi:hypothetical protein
VKLRSTRITIETHRLVVFRCRRVVRSWCDECGGESEFVPVDDLNGLLEGEAGGAGTQLHFARMRDGAALVCVKSLPGPA